MMLEFCVRHNIYPNVEEFPMSKSKWCNGTPRKR
jgi:hypothetical protein